MGEGFGARGADKFESLACQPGALRARNQPRSASTQNPQRSKTQESPPTRNNLKSPTDHLPTSESRTKWPPPLHECHCATLRPCYLLTTPRQLLPATAHLPPSGSWVQVPTHTCTDAAAPHAVGRSVGTDKCWCSSTARAQAGWLRRVNAAALGGGGGGAAARPAAQRRLRQAGSASQGA
jgi:hypothetical protein